MKNLLYCFLDKLLSLETVIVGRKKWILRFFENESTQLITILIYYTIIFALTIYGLSKIQVSNYAYSFLIIAFILIVLKTLMIWRARQKSVIVVNIKKKQNIKNFNLSISNTILKRLYFNFCKYNVLDELVVKESSFLKIFCEDFNSNSEVIDFQLELAQIKYLFEKIIKTDSLIKSNRYINGFGFLKYSDFEKAKKFKHRGEYITSKKLSDNYYKAKNDNPTKLLEFQELIDNIFKESLDI
ncbi:hypothetical protein [Flavobacterium sp. ASW18X]|uniref:hypothetical protein n=1 Tax=Flavobacterium sp. ASW18X TaxID=2572595 RepID=UPI0010AE5B69|nr:hypothetical protein [Flavobacterium sp. ASW18X]TKD66521.1 hypothetical protein FBT53_01300 [Flavobacterium sp. ASW18X]